MTGIFHAIAEGLKAFTSIFREKNRPDVIKGKMEQRKQSREERLKEAIRTGDTKTVQELLAEKNTDSV